MWFERLHAPDNRHVVARLEPFTTEDDAEVYHIGRDVKGAAPGTLEAKNWR